MKIDTDRIDAVTLDFYNTLVYHSEGSGRGAMLMEYLSSRKLDSNPWEHQVLYELFAEHRTEYSPHFDVIEKRAYLERLTARLFEILDVRVPPREVAEHAGEIWRVLGPGSLAVYPEVPQVLRGLRAAGYRLSIVSNWQCGLEHFCYDLGISGDVDHIVASADVGFAKPDPRIFQLACALMEVPCDRVLHVGDSVVDDIEGGMNVGMQVLLVDRSGDTPPSNSRGVRSLVELLQVLRIEGEHNVADST